MSFKYSIGDQVIYRGDTHSCGQTSVIDSKMFPAGSRLRDDVGAFDSCRNANMYLLAEWPDTWCIEEFVFPYNPPATDSFENIITELNIGTTSEKQTVLALGGGTLLPSPWESVRNGSSCSSSEKQAITQTSFPEVSDRWPVGGGHV